MRLTIKRSYEPPAPGEQYSSPYRSHAVLELTDEEKDLVDRYQLGEHVLTRSKYRATKLSHLILGSDERLASLDIAMGNEEVLREACATLPALFDYCRSFGRDIVVQYSA